MFNQTSREFKTLAKLTTPEKIQGFLDTIPMNHEKDGETCMSPKQALSKWRAHCFEGALIACACFMIQGVRPRIVNLKVKQTDYDHIITIFQKHGYYGAISKTNHGVLRYRDPIYRTVRELILSYYHEYFLVTTGEKTLLGYSKPIDIVGRFGTDWVTQEDNLWDMAEKIYDTPYTRVVPPINQRYIRKASVFERKIASIPEW